MDAAESFAHVRGARLTHEGGAVAAAAIEAKEKETSEMKDETLKTLSLTLSQAIPAK